MNTKKKERQVGQEGMKLLIPSFLKRMDKLKNEDQAMGYLSQVC